MKLSAVGLNRTFIFFGVISVFCLLRPVLSCQCTSLTIQDQRTGRFIGNCLTRARQNGQFFCYVAGTSGCFDRRPSARAAGLFWSSHACDLEGNTAAAFAAAPAADFGGRNKRSVMHEYKDYNDDSDPIYENNYEQQDYAKPKQEYSDYNDDSYKSKPHYGEHKGYDAGSSPSYQSEPIYGNNYEQQDYAKPKHEYSDYNDDSYKSKPHYGEHKGYDARSGHSYQSEPTYRNNYEQQDYATPKQEYSDYNDDSYKSKSQYGETKGYDTGRSHSNYEQQDYAKPHIGYLEEVYGGGHGPDEYNY
jgi:hypothetical protein